MLFSKQYNMNHISWLVREVLTGLLLLLLSSSGCLPHNHIAVFGIQPRRFLARDTTSPSDQCLLGSFNGDWDTRRKRSSGSFGSVLATKTSEWRSLTCFSMSYFLQQKPCDVATQLLLDLSEFVLKSNFFLCLMESFVNKFRGQTWDSGCTTSCSSQHFRGCEFSTFSTRSAVPNRRTRSRHRGTDCTAQHINTHIALLGRQRQSVVGPGCCWEHRCISQYPPAWLGRWWGNRRWEYWLCASGHCEEKTDT